MGTQLNVVNDVINGNRKITYEQLKKFISEYKLNRSYFYSEVNKKIPLYRIPPAKIEIVHDVTPAQREIADRYRAIRETLQLTQEQIAAEISCGQSHWAHLEMGLYNPNDRIKSALNNIFGIRYEFMIDGAHPIRKPGMRPAARREALDGKHSHMDGKAHSDGRESGYQHDGKHQKSRRSHG